MAGNLTFGMIKPGAYKGGHTGAILSVIQRSGFELIGMKLTKVTKQQAEKFYIVHKGKPFYEELTVFLSCGPIVAFVLKKENAVAAFRKLLGATDPHNAQEGTLRRMFATSLSKNAVHGSDSDENAMIESNFFFSEFERFSQGECKC